MRNFVTGALASGVLLVGVVGQAQAATTIGRAATDSVTNCSAGFAWVQNTADLSSPSYTVPAGGGVITAWSHDVSADTPTTATMRLKVFRKTAPQTYLTVGHSVAQPLTSPGLKTFATSVSVQGGDLLGLRTGGSGETDCFRSAQSGDVTEDGPADPAPGEPFTSVEASSATSLNIAAVVETDCDKDGLGDETQDADTGSCNPPPADTDAPETTITKGAPNKTDKSTVKFKFTSTRQARRSSARSTRSRSSRAPPRRRSSASTRASTSSRSGRSTRPGMSIRPWRRTSSRWLIRGRAAIT